MEPIVEPKRRVFLRPVRKDESSGTLFPVNSRREEGDAVIKPPSSAFPNQTTVDFIYSRKRNINTFLFRPFYLIHAFFYLSGQSSVPSFPKTFCFSPNLYLLRPNLSPLLKPTFFALSAKIKPFLVMFYLFVLSDWYNESKTSHFSCSIVSVGEFILFIYI